MCELSTVNVFSGSKWHKDTENTVEVQCQNSLECKRDSEAN